MKNTAFEEAETVLMTADMARRLRQQVLISQREAQERACRRHRLRRFVLLAVLVAAAGVGLVL